MSFTMSFRTGKDGELVFGERPQYREEFLKNVPIRNDRMKGRIR